MRVPLLYKAGILRDGTTFQDEYCTDGQWIRFVNGKIKKMKGQVELNASPNNVEYMHIIPDGTTPYLFYATPGSVNRLKLNLQTNTLTDNIDITPTGGITNQSLSTWSSVAYIKDTVPFLAVLRTLNKNNMLATNPGELYVKQFDAQPLVLKDIGTRANLISGGILYSAPCLYLYGNNGTILRSETSDPLSFDGGDSAIYTISSDKLIFGASVRGGSNAPSFLFWTANSVIYLTNVADSNSVTPVDFQKEVVTNNSSLMSSRSVVQYDSLFFWLGTDRIFVYNGIVDSIPNTMNLEYFFDNVDLNKRQLIFGYKIARYGEVRWAYPEKQYANDAHIGCTRELVYNVRENSWYDTVIQRDCVTVYEGTGDIFSYGDSCTNYPYNYQNRYAKIWRHELGDVEIRANSIVNIPSFFITPFYGFVTFNPAKNGNAIDKYIVLDQIEPDFTTNGTRTAADELVITVNCQKYAGSTISSTVPITFKLADLQQAPNLGKIDFRVQGRFMNIKFYCEYPYDVGTVLLNFKEGDSQ